MSSVVTPPSTSAPSTTGLSPAADTLAGLIEQLGDIPLARIRRHPPPGMATLQDLAECEARQNCLCELVDGVLVEKPMGFRESIVATIISVAIQKYNEAQGRGIVTGADGMLQLIPNLVRLPDVAFTSWNRFPDGTLPSDAAPLAWPDLAVEVLSASNTRREMERKRAEYFRSGTLLVWMVDLDKRTIAVYSSPDTYSELQEADALDGGEVLPGFSMPVKDVFTALNRQVPRTDH